MMLTCTGSFCCVRQVAANALIKKGSLLIQKDLNKEAMECFARAEELDPRNSDIFHHRGQVRGGGARNAAAKSWACELVCLPLELFLPFFLPPSVFLSQLPVARKLGGRAVSWGFEPPLEQSMHDMPHGLWKPAVCGLP